MSADKKIDKNDLPQPEKKPRNQQPEEYIQSKPNFEEKKEADEPMPGAPRQDDQPVKR